MTPADPSKNKSTIAMACLLAGLLVLFADFWLLPVAPYPSHLLRYGLGGALFAPCLLLAAVALVRDRTGGRLPDLLSALPLAIAFVPMIADDDWAIPMVRIFTWAAAAPSVEALWAGVSTVVVLVPLTMRLLGPWGPTRRFSARLSLGTAMLYPWASLIAQYLLFESAASSRMLVSALSLTVALPLLLLGWDALPEMRQALTLQAGDKGWRRGLLVTAPVVPLLFIYFVIKLETLAPSATDENIYFYAASLFARGKMPYRDFFFAHPPLHLLIPGMLTLVFGFSFTLLKLLSVVASLLSGLFIYLAVRRSAGLLAGLLAGAFFLFAFQQLQAGTNLTGINITTMSLTAALYMVIRGSPVAAGALAGCSVLAGVYAAGPVLALAAVAFYQNWKRGLQYVGLLVAVAGLGNLLFYLLFGAPYIDQVFTYHFLKPSKTKGFLAPGTVDLFLLFISGCGYLALCTGLGEWVRAEGSLRARLLTSRPLQVCAATAACLALVAACGSFLPAAKTGLALLFEDGRLFLDGQEFLRFYFFHAHLLLAPLALAVGLVAFALLRSSPLAAQAIPAVLAGFSLMLAGLVELALLRETYTFYYLLVIPGAAVLCALSWRLVPEAFALHPGPAGPKPWQPALATILLAAVVALNTLYVPRTLAVGAQRFPEEKQRAGELTCYPPVENVTTPFSQAIRSHLMTSCRFRGSSEPGLYHYLWKKKWYFSKAPEIARYIRENSNERETVVGSSLVTPLLALLSSRSIAAHFVDTNSKRFKSGMLENEEGWKPICRKRPGWNEPRCRQVAAEQEMWRAVCRTPVRFIIAGPRSFFTPRRMKNHPVARRYFKPDKLFNETQLSKNGKYPIVLFRRVADAPEGSGRYCSFLD